MRGIDYGRGRQNIDRSNGIRYGVISTHSLSSWVIGEAEPIYPDTVDTQCPECGMDFETDVLCPDDYQTCPECGHEFRDRSLEDIEPIDWDYSGGDTEYITEHSESLNCVFFTHSPYFTYGRYCSPCAPGAVDLDSPDTDGDRGYCPGHDWFEDGIAPYPVFSVATGELVIPPAKPDSVPIPCPPSDH